MYVIGEYLNAIVARLIITMSLLVSCIELSYRPFTSTQRKQNPELPINLLGDNCCLTKGGFNYFPPSVSLSLSCSPHPVFNQSNLFTLFLNDF